MKPESRHDKALVINRCRQHQFCFLKRENLDNFCSPCIMKLMANLLVDSVVDQQLREHSS